LNLFQSTLDVNTPKTPQEVIVELARVYQAVADGSVSEAQGEKLTGILTHITKGIELGDIEARIIALEEKAHEKHQKAQ